MGALEWHLHCCNIICLCLQLQGLLRYLQFSQHMVMTQRGGNKLSIGKASQLAIQLPACELSVWMSLSVLGPFQSLS